MKKSKMLLPALMLSAALATSCTMKSNSDGTITFVDGVRVKTVCGPCENGQDHICRLRKPDKLTCHEKVWLSFNSINMNGLSTAQREQAENTYRNTLWAEWNRYRVTHSKDTEFDPKVFFERIVPNTIPCYDFVNHKPAEYAMQNYIDSLGLWQ